MRLREEPTVTEIQSVCQQLAAVARFAMELTGAEREAAIDAAILSAQANRESARQRTGPFRFETYSHEIEDAYFRGSVADDARDNTYRPSTGPVRDYVRSAI